MSFNNLFVHSFLLNDQVLFTVHHSSLSSDVKYHLTLFVVLQIKFSVLFFGQIEMNPEKEEDQIEEGELMEDVFLDDGSGDDNNKTVSNVNQVLRQMDLESELNNACLNNQLKKVQLLLKLGANTHWDALTLACENGYLDIAQVIWDHIKHSNPLQQSTLLHAAFRVSCAKGRIPSIQWIINQGFEEWGQGLIYACDHGHIHLVDWFISKAKQENKASYWNQSLMQAGFRNHRDIICLLFEKCGSKIDLNKSLAGACQSGNKEFVLWIIDKIQQSGKVCDWDDGLSGAVCGEQIHMAKMMMEFGADNWKFCLQYNIHHSPCAKFIYYECGVDLKDLSLNEFDIPFFLNRNVNLTTDANLLFILKQRQRCQSSCKITFRQTKLNAFVQLFVLPCIPYCE